MKILQICKKFPFPFKDGESIAIHQLSKSLHHLGAEVTLLAMNTSKHFFEGKNYPPELDHYKEIVTEQVDNRLKAKDAFLNLFSRDSYHISRFVAPAFGKRLATILQNQEFDIIQLETLYLAPYIPVIRKHSNAPVVLRAHNVEHEIWERIARHTPTGPKKWYLQHLAEKLKRYEVSCLNNIDLLVAISERDLKNFKQLGCRKPGFVTPIGIDAKNYQPDFRSIKKEPALAFIGSLDWMPNREGLIWFLHNIWPGLLQRFPKLQLHIAGRNTPDWLEKKQIPNVTFHGEVEDAPTFLNQYPIMIVPLLSGSGMRAKILEGMALGKAILTTKLGLEGIDAQHKKEVWVADDLPDYLQFFDHLESVGLNEIQAMGTRAKTFVEGRYDSDHIARQLMHLFASLSVEAI